MNTHICIIINIFNAIVLSILHRTNRHHVEICSYEMCFNRKWKAGLEFALWNSAITWLPFYERMDTRQVTRETKVRNFTLPDSDNRRVYRKLSAGGVKNTLRYSTIIYMRLLATLLVPGPSLSLSLLPYVCVCVYLVCTIDSPRDLVLNWISIGLKKDDLESINGGME